MISEDRLVAWQRRSAWPMIILSLVYIAAYTIPIYFYPLASPWSRTLDDVGLATWGVFIVDYAVQFALAGDKRHFLRTDWLALVLVVFPFLRPIRAIRGLLFIRQATSENRSLLRELPWILGFMAVLLIVIAGAAVLSAERFAPGATIRTPSDALWWAVSSTTSSTSGNLSPVTVEGRIVATALRLFGLGLFTSMAGLIAAWFMTYFHIDKGLVVRTLDPASDDDSEPTTN
jgi:voltage-gated potassium channel